MHSPLSELYGASQHGNSLISFTHYIYWRLRTKVMRYVISKAFNKVPHSTLIHWRVDLINPYLIQWIRNYLTGRQQAVVLDGVESCMC